MNLKVPEKTVHRLALVAALVAGAFAVPGVAQESTVDVYSIKVFYEGHDISPLTKLLDHPYVDQKGKVVLAEVSGEELAKVRALGMPVEVDAAETARIQNFVTSRTADAKSGALNRSDIKQPSSIANGAHSCYRTVEQIYTTYDELLAKYPKLVKVQDLGKSWLGTQYKLPAVGTTVPDNTTSSFANLL
ncbi:MAG: hypothetical protein JWP52_3703, partial [Rhizobacter sp.]|nr:hypothetical protein [Rhizobacter sp.]